MSPPQRPQESPGAREPLRKEAAAAKRHSAVVLGNGTILPIAETLGRRFIREIEPLSSEGRRLLGAGLVTLVYEDGSRVETAPIHEVLDRLSTSTRLRRDAYPDLDSWTVHHDRVLKSISRMKKILKPRP